MVRSITTIAEVKPEKPPVKVAEIVIGFIRFPGVSNTDIIAKTRFPLNKELENIGYVENPRIRTATVISEEIVYDVYEYQSPVIDWATIIVILLGVLVGALATICIMLYLRVVELEVIIEETGRMIEEVITDKETALKEGLIDPEYAEKLNEQLEKAKEKTEEAGRTDWWNFLEPVAPFITLLPLLLILLIILAFIPRRR